ncbi:MAG: hypothetical protein PUJ35_02550 [Ruminococcus bromii]|nr:hypothetical protein [Ruminococcus bromii]
MKKTLALLLALVVALSLCACGGKGVTTENEPSVAPIVVDGEESSVKDFLIEHLSAYIQSDEYVARKTEFENTFGQEAQPFAVTYAFELKMDNYGNEGIPIHFFMVKANCNYCMDGGSGDSMIMAIDYDTGTVYDQFSVDESWMEKGNKEEAICVAVATGCFGSSDYNGDPIFTDSEVHIPLSDSDIAEINQALTK